MANSAIRVILSITSSNHFYDYTGILTKTLVYTLNKEVALLHGVRGILQPLLISPPFTLGKKDLEIGELVAPVYTKDENGKWQLSPLLLDGEYIVHIGGESRIVKSIENSLNSFRETLSIKIENSIFRFKIEKVEDVTNKIIKNRVALPGKVKVYLKSPAMIFNVFATTKLPKFSVSAVEVLMTPYMFSKNAYTMNYNVLLEASRLLGLLVETWYSIKTAVPIMIPFKGKREVAMSGYITYLIDTNNKEKLEEIAGILSLAEILGIGKARQNGFGTVVVLP